MGLRAVWTCDRCEREMPVPDVRFEIGAKGVNVTFAPVYCSECLPKVFAALDFHGTLLSPEFRKAFGIPAKAKP